MGKLKEMYDDQELHNLIDSYYALDFEDVISGGLKTRFKVYSIESKLLKTNKYSISMFLRTPTVLQMMNFYSLMIKYWASSYQ